MNKYEITGRAIRLTSGVLELSADQARRRKHLIKSLGDRLYEIVNTVEFKQGELIGFNGNIPKSLNAMLKKQKSKVK